MVQKGLLKHLFHCGTLSKIKESCPVYLLRAFAFLCVEEDEQATKVSGLKKHHGFSKQTTQAAVVSIPIFDQDK